MPPVAACSASTRCTAFPTTAKWRRRWRSCLRTAEQACLLAATLTGCGDAEAPASAVPVCGEADARLLLPLPEREYVERVEPIDDGALLVLETVAYDDAVPHPAEVGR